MSVAIADLVPPEERPRAYGYLYWAINLGFAMAPVVAGLIARFDYFLLFVGDAVTTFVFGLIILAGVSETRPAEAHAASKAPLRQRIGQLRSSPLMLLFCAVALGFGIIYMQANVTLPVDMASHGLGPEKYGLAIAVNGVLIVILGLPASHAAGRWPRYGAMAVAAILAGVGFGLTGLASTLLLFGLSIGVWTLGEIAASTIAPAIVPTCHRSSCAGCSRAHSARRWGLSAFAGPLLGGWVYQQLGAGALWSGCLLLGGLPGAGLSGAWPARTARRPDGSIIPYSGATPSPAGQAEFTGLGQRRHTTAAADRTSTRLALCHAPCFRGSAFCSAPQGTYPRGAGRGIW